MRITFPMVVESEYLTTLAKFKGSPDWRIVRQIVRDTAADLDACLRRAKHIHERTTDKLRIFTSLPQRWDCPDPLLARAAEIIHCAIEWVQTDELRNMALLRQEVHATLRKALAILRGEETANGQPPTTPSPDTLPFTGTGDSAGRDDLRPPAEVLPSL